MKNELQRDPNKIQQFWYFVPAPGERVRAKWVELDLENLSLKWKEASEQPRETFEKHLQKFGPTSAIDLSILDGKLYKFIFGTNMVPTILSISDEFDDHANDVAFLLADKFTEEQKSIAEGDFYKLLYKNKNHSNGDFNVFDSKKGVATLIYDKRGDITYKQQNTNNNKS